MLELEIECMESNYFIPGDDCRTITTLRKQSFIILKKKPLCDKTRRDRREHVIMKSLNLVSFVNY